jgi:ribonuclease D
MSAVKLHYIEPTPPEQRPVYQAMKKWRQDMAASKDIYPENFLRLASLEQIVARRPMELDDLQSGCGISQKFIREHGAEVVLIFQDDFAKTLASLNSD